MDALAVLPAPSSAYQLRQVTGLDDETLLEATEALLARRLVRPVALRDQSGTGYEFAHALVRRAVRDAMDPARRDALERAASTVRSAGAPNAPLVAGETRAPVGRRWGWAVAATVAAATLVAVGALIRSWGTPTMVVGVDRVAVFPFVVQGAPAYAYLGDGLADLLHATLDGAGNLHAVEVATTLAQRRGAAGPVDARDATLMARAHGAGQFVLGRVLESGGQLQLTATLHDSAGRRVGSANVGPSDEAGLFALVDELGRKLLALRPASAGTRLQQLAARTSSSLPALKHFLHGEQRFRAAAYGEAYDAYQAAAAADSAFALAHYRAAVAAEWSGRTDRIRPAVQLAERHAHRLPAQQRTLLEAYAAYSRGDARTAESRYRAMAVERPDDIDAWWGLGEVLFHLAPASGRAIAESRAPFERVLSLTPTHEDAVLHLVRLAAVEGDSAAVDTLMAGLTDIARPGSIVAPSIRAVQAHVGMRPALRDSVRAELASGDPLVASVALFHVALYSGDLAGASALAMQLTEPRQPTAFRALGEVYRAQLAVARGRWTDAARALARAAVLHPTLAGAVGHELATIPLAPPGWRGPAPGAGEPVAHVVDPMASFLLRAPSFYERIARLQRDAGSGSTWPHPEALGVADPAVAWRGEEDERALLRAMSAAGRARVLAAHGDVHAALDELARLQYDAWYFHAIGAPFFARSADRFLEAQLLEQAGRLDEALQAYASFAHYALSDLPWRPAALLRQASLQHARGDHVAARQSYRIFLRLWRDADDTGTPHVEAARRALRALGAN